MTKTTKTITYDQLGDICTDALDELAYKDEQVFQAQKERRRAEAQANKELRATLERAYNQFKTLIDVTPYVAVKLALKEQRDTVEGWLDTDVTT